MVKLAAGIAVALCACGKFQDPNIVVDLRVLAMTASVPEQVVTIDPANPSIAALLPQLVPSNVCALVSDPSFPNRSLRWSMTLCVQELDDRCHDGDPQHVIGSGLLANPDVTVPQPNLCATIEPDGNLIGVLLSSLQGDVLHALQGEQYEVVLRIGGDDVDPALDLYAGKALQLTPRIPPDRVPNHNPTLSELDVTLPENGPMPLPLGRCVDQTEMLQVFAGTKVRLTPVEPPGVHEMYSIELLDGTFETFTESITYQWIAGDGKFSSGDTGGPHDRFGNVPPLFTDWTAPSSASLMGPTEVPIWIVQRDERLGAAWYESCIRVLPTGM